MAWLKSVEHWAKVLLAATLALLLARPWRRGRRARLAHAKRVLLVRIDNRVGEVLLTTPLVNALVDRGLEVHVLVHPSMARVVDGLPGVAQVWPFVRTLATVRSLRAQRFDVVVNCGNWATPAVTSAIAARLVGGAGVVVGPRTPPTSWLADVAVPALPNERSEVKQRANLLTPLLPTLPALRLSFRTPRPSDAVRAALSQVSRPFAVVNPGGRLGERRVPPSVFAAGAKVLAAAGLTPVVTWGPGEEPLADEVLAACPTAVRAPATDLDGLAALMSAATMTLCNNTGPMHLAVAVASPTLAFFSRIDMARWSHPAPPHHAVDLTAALASPAEAVRLAESEVRKFAESQIISRR